MKRFIAVGMVSMLAVGLTVGLALAAAGPGGPGRGPGPGGPGPGDMRPGGPPPGGPGMGPGPGGQQPGGPGGPGGPGMQRRGPPPLGPALEQKMGKPLTEEQRGQIGEAGKAQFEGIKAARDAFAQKVAEITGLPLDKVQQLLPPGPPPPPGGPGQGGPGQGGPGMRGPGQGGRGQGGPGQGGPGQGGPGMGGPGQGGQVPPHPGAMLARRLEQALGKPLTKEQMESLQAAGEAHRDAVKPVHEAFVKRISEITGLSPEDLKDVLPGPGPHGPPPMPPQGPPQGPPPAPQGGTQQ